MLLSKHKCYLKPSETILIVVPTSRVMLQDPRCPIHPFRERGSVPRWSRVARLTDPSRRAFAALCVNRIARTFPFALLTTALPTSTIAFAIAEHLFSADSSLPEGPCRNLLDQRSSV
jgi:hypothetical protein